MGLLPADVADITAGFRWLADRVYSALLERGKFADLVVLESDPREADPNSIGDIRILETWKGGRRVFST